MKRFCCIALLFLLFAFFIGAAWAVEITVFGPEEYVRTSGKLDSYSDIFPGLEGTGKLVVTNGDESGEHRISSAKIEINGSPVLGPGNFNQWVDRIEVPLTLRDENSISVTLESKPGSFLTVQVVQEVEAEAAEVVGPDGGEIEIVDPASTLEGVVLDIPAGALASNQIITISAARDLPPFEEGNHGIGPGISLEPNGLTFDIPVTVTVTYSDESLDANNIVDEESIKLYLLDETLGIWIAEDSAVDHANNSVTAELSHFSTYKLNGAKLETHHFNMLYARAPILFVHGIKIGVTSFYGNSLYGDCEKTFGLALDAIADEEINVYALNYDTGQDITSTARSFALALRKIQDENHAGHINVIAHSMGGLVARAYIHGMAKAAAQVIIAPGQTPTPEEYKDEVGKLLMMGTPNHGSNLADLLVLIAGDDTWWIVNVYPSEDSWEQLEEGSDNTFLNELNTREFPSGLVVENAYGKVSDREDDGVVSRESARLAEYAEQGDLYHKITEHELFDYYHCRFPVLFWDKGIVDVTDPVEDHEGYRIMKSFALSTADPVNGVTGKIPDTGQTTSYTDTFGEDSDYDINPQSYTRLDSNGDELDDSAFEWAMIRDNVTGLIWENKTDDGGIHDKDNSYTWYDAQDVFIAELNQSDFGGHDDWRLPTVTELSWLVRADKPYPGPSIDTTYFQNSNSSYYWSSTTYAGYPDYAWHVHFYGGYVIHYGDKSDSSYVRAVRGGQ
ncbi:MAG: hypothetical protein AVO38_01780 [delta proteobacterium ML8_D]|nr:MAG: hypothetical protein AVO38_01780 [delta proteobacterium ML8_D]